MNLAQLKTKELKGKKKPLPKLTTILVNPIKIKCPTLNEDEFKGLCSLLQNVICQSGMNPKQFKAAKQIQLGLESSLRAINNCQSSCVFISLNIKPSHIISLIARNARVKDGTQPVYAQPNLEDFTEQLFGIRSLTLVFPRHLQEISLDLHEWVEKRKISKKVPQTLENQMKNLNKFKFTKVNNEETFQKLEENVNKLPFLCPSDFVSLDENESNFKAKKLKLEAEEKDELESVLLDIVKVENIQKDPVNIEQVPELSKIEINEEHSKDDDTDKDFLDVYQTGIVHYVKPNPNSNKRTKKNNKEREEIRRKTATLPFNNSCFGVP